MWDNVADSGWIVATEREEWEITCARASNSLAMRCNAETGGRCGQMHAESWKKQGAKPQYFHLLILAIPGMYEYTHLYPQHIHTTYSSRHHLLVPCSEALRGHLSSAARRFCSVSIVCATTVINISPRFHWVLSLNAWKVNQTYRLWISQLPHSRRYLIPANFGTTLNLLQGWRAAEDNSHKNCCFDVFCWQNYLELALGNFFLLLKGFMDLKMTKWAFVRTVLKNPDRWKNKVPPRRRHLPSPSSVTQCFCLVSIPLIGYTDAWATVVVVFTLNRSFYPTTSAGHPVSFPDSSC